MKKVLLCVCVLILAMPVIVFAQNDTVLAPDSNEFRNISAIKDTAKRIDALESFLAKYPASLARQEAFEILARSAKESGNFNLVISTSTELVKEFPNNLTGLSYLTYQCQVAGGSFSDEDLEKRQQICDDSAERGLAVLEDSTSLNRLPEKDRLQTKKSLARMFHAQLGIHALRKENFPKAQKHLLAAVEISEKDFSVIYPLALAYIQAPTPDCVNGLWYLARSVATAPTPQATKQITEYGREQYVKFVGNEAGWTDLLAQAKTAAVPPPSVKIACNTR